MCVCLCVCLGGCNITIQSQGSGEVVIIVNVFIHVPGHGCFISSCFAHIFVFNLFGVMCSDLSTFGD